MTTGLFTYFGDNRRPGKKLDKTHIGGNRLLEKVFDLLHNGDRESICPVPLLRKVSRREWQLYALFGPRRSRCRRTVKFG